MGQPMNQGASNQTTMTKQENNQLQSTNLCLREALERVLGINIRALHNRGINYRYEPEDIRELITAAQQFEQVNKERDETRQVVHAQLASMVDKVRELRKCIELSLEDWKREHVQLQSTNLRLREALECVSRNSNTSYLEGKQSLQDNLGSCKIAAETALSTTPAPNVIRKDDEVLVELSELLRQYSATMGHNHWDNTMQHGAGCPMCILQREYRDKVTNVLQLAHQKGIGVKQQ